MFLHKPSFASQWLYLKLYWSFIVECKSAEDWGHLWRVCHVMQGFIQTSHCTLRPRQSEEKKILQQVFLDWKSQVWWQNYNKRPLAQNRQVTKGSSSVVARHTAAKTRLQTISVIREQTRAAPTAFCRSVGGQQQRYKANTSRRTCL